MEIKRDQYLKQLIAYAWDGQVKVITGIRRCGKSYLLRTIYRNHLLKSGVPEDHIIAIALDLAGEAHEEEARKAVEAQKRADVYECIDALINTLAWYYPMYKDYSDSDIDSITETLVKSCDLLEKVFNSKDASFLDVLGLGQFAPKTKGPVEKDKSGDVSFDTIVKAFLGE